MRNVFILGCLLFSLTAIGQKHSILINYKPSLTFFGKQSQNFTNHYFAKRGESGTFNNAFNFLYQHKISKRINLTSGIEYAQQGQRIDFKLNNTMPENYTVQYKISLDYFRIPLTIDYTVFSKGNFSFNIYSGLSLGFAVKREDNYQDIIFEQILLPSANKRFKKVDLELPLGINSKKYLGKNIFGNFGLEYMFGLTNSFKDDGASKFGVLSQFKNSKQSRLAVNFGIGFDLGK